MTARLLANYEDRSPEWLELRHNRVGGSDLGPIMGWSPFQTRAGLMAEKLGHTEPKPQSKSMSRGIYLEDGIRRWLCDSEGVELDEARSSGTWCDTDDDRLMYNPDGVTSDGCLIEIKCVEFRNEEHGWGRQGKSTYLGVGVIDRIPLHYRAQVIWGMGILGLAHCLVGVLGAQPSFGFARYAIDAQPDTFNYLRSQAVLFLDELAANQANQEVAA